MLPFCLRYSDDSLTDPSLWCETSRYWGMDWDELKRGGSSQFRYLSVGMAEIEYMDTCLLGLDFQQRHKVYLKPWEGSCYIWSDVHRQHVKLDCAKHFQNGLLMIRVDEWRNAWRENKDFRCAYKLTDIWDKPETTPFGPHLTCDRFCDPENSRVPQLYGDDENAKDDPKRQGLNAYGVLKRHPDRPATGMLAESYEELEDAPAHHSDSSKSPRLDVTTHKAYMDSLESSVLLDRSGHDQIRTFGPISHVSGPEMIF